jgi:hypothetical protein
VESKVKCINLVDRVSEIGVKRRTGLVDSPGDRNGERGGGIFVLSIGMAVVGVMFDLGVATTVFFVIVAAGLSGDALLSRYTNTRLLKE